MGADIVNLRLARKRKARETAEREAAVNRAAFGQDKASRQGAKADRDREARKLDGHRLNEDG